MATKYAVAESEWKDIGLKLCKFAGLFKVGALKEAPQVIVDAQLGAAVGEGAVTGYRTQMCTELCIAGFEGPKVCVKMKNARFGRKPGASHTKMYKATDAEHGEPESHSKVPLPLMKIWGEMTNIQPFDANRQLTTGQWTEATDIWFKKVRVGPSARTRVCDQPLFVASWWVGLSPPSRIEVKRYLDPAA